MTPIWSPDGADVLFSRGDDRRMRLMRQPLRGGAPTCVLDSEGPKFASDWSSDGRFIAYTSQVPDYKQLHVWLLDCEAQREPRPFLQHSYYDASARFAPAAGTVSPRWIAYTSAETGRPEVYVRDFPGGRDKWRVSTHGGLMPHWRRDGQELYYVAPDGALMAVDVSIAGMFEAGRPRRLFDAGLTFVPRNKTWMNQYAVARDGQRFLVNRPVPESAPAAITGRDPALIDARPVGASVRTNDVRYFAVTPLLGLGRLPSDGRRRIDGTGKEMVSRAIDAIDRRATQSMSLRATDRWLFAFMAALFFVTVLVGFVPDSFGRLAAIQAGRRPPFHPLTHLHAVLMGAWLLLLLAQATLVATNRRALHRRLRLVSLMLAPTMVLVGVGLVPAVFRMAWSVDAPPPGIDAAVMAETKAVVANLVLPQIRVGILFPIVVGWALWVRRTDPGTHKRLMILATALPLPAAIDRIVWLPTTMPASHASADLYMLLWVAPMFLHDLIRHGSVQRAYVIWFLAGLPPTIAVHALWGSAWWLATVPKLMGVEP